jgi:hypothetical protein
MFGPWRWKAFLNAKSYQPIIRHGDRAYNAAGV